MDEVVEICFALLRLIGVSLNVKKIYAWSKVDKKTDENWKVDVFDTLVFLVVNKEDY